MAVVHLLIVSGCAGTNGDNRNLVYEDMKTTFEQSGLLSANIGIFSKNEQDDSISFGEPGSGVIIGKENGTYYALTAAHVVSSEHTQLLVFTVNTEMNMDTIPGMDYSVPSLETYEKMYPANIEYISNRDDLAVIRFSTDEELSVITLADENPEKGDRIMCIGNPQNEWFAISYGEVTSGIQTFGETQGFPSNAMKHNAYIHMGSSGGAAFNENMQLIGITPGGYFSADGKTYKYGVLIPVSEIKICFDEFSTQ